VTDNVTIEGQDTLARTLDDAAGKLAEMPEADAKAAAIVAGHAKTLAPKRSGRLAGSIGVTRDGPDTYVAATVVYAGVIEYGWPRHNIAANPYMAPAAEYAEPAVSAVYGDAVAQAISRVRGR
jgi:phage gpG-like protein